MDQTSDRVREPTVDDLRVKLCYICREEERHDNPPHPPPVWTHPCKCTLVAHESCLLHWIKTQQRDFGRSRGDLKCPQCGELYEFDGFNPVVLRIFNTVNRTLSRSGRFVTACSVGTIVLSSGAGVYLTCMSYGAFAVREFLGPDIFQTLLTTNPANWPLHAWFYLPMVPFSLIVSRTPLVFWSTSPLVPLLFPWPSTIPVSAVGAVSRRMRVGPFAGRPALWPPPPALVCALFPIVRVLYGRLRDRVVRAMVQDLVPTQAEAAQRRQQRRIEQGRPEHQRRGNQQDLPQRPQQQRQEQQHQQPQQQQQLQHQQQLPPGAARRFQFQVGEQFAFEIAHIVLDHNAPAPADAPGPAPAVAVGDIAVDGDGGAAVDNPANQQQQQQPAQGRRPLPPAPVGQERRPLPLAPVGQEPQRQRPPPELQQRRAEPGQEQGQEPAAAPRDENDLGAVAARAIRVTGASLGRLIGGALLMPSIARMMGSMLLHISHVVPLVRTIIAPLPPLPPMPQPPASPSGPISALVGLIRGARDFGPKPDAALRRPFGGTTHVGGGGGGGGWLGGRSLGATLLRGFLTTSEEWATRDPVWWRNALGLGIFLVVKDGLKILHLWLAKRELEERHIKSKSFAGIDLTGLDLIERVDERQE